MQADNHEERHPAVRWESRAVEKIDLYSQDRGWGAGNPWHLCTGSQVTKIEINLWPSRPSLPWWTSRCWLWILFSVANRLDEPEPRRKRSNRAGPVAHWRRNLHITWKLSGCDGEMWSTEHLAPTEWVFVYWAPTFILDDRDAGGSASSVSRHSSQGLRCVTRNNDFTDGITTLGLVEKIQSLMRDLLCEPEHFTDRIIFVSICNDIVWRIKGNTERCEFDSQTVAELCSWTAALSLVFVGAWNRKALMANFSGSGHPIFRASSALERGE